MEISKKEKFKSMSIKEKLDYIWEYYKVHIIISFFLIIIATSIIHDKLTQVDTYCSLTYFNTFTDEENFNTLQDNLNKTLLPDNKKEAVKFELIFTDASFGLPPNQELSAKIAAKEIDLVIVSREFFDNQASEDMFLDLSSLKGFNKLNLSDEMIIKAMDSSGKNAALGIDVSKLPFFKDTDLNSQDNVLALIINSERKENALKVIEELIK